MSADTSRSLVPELLGLVAILAVLRFVLVPILDWQDEQVLQLNLLEKRFSKVNELLVNDANYEGQFQAIEDAYQAERARLFTVVDEANFKLQQQVLIENIMAKYELKVNNFGWNPAISKDAFGVFIYPAVLRIEGSSFSLMQAMSEIEALPQAVLIADFEFRVQNQFADSLGRASGRMVLHFLTDATGGDS